MPRVTILDPTAPPPEVSADPGPDAGPLSGRKVGIRHDPTWRSFEWIMDEWAASFRNAGAAVETWTAGARTGVEGEQTEAALEAFGERVEVAVLGLGN